MHLSCELTLLAVSNLTSTRVAHPCFAQVVTVVCLEALLLVWDVCVTYMKARARRSGCKSPSGQEGWWRQRVQCWFSQAGRSLTWGDFVASSAEILEKETMTGVFMYVPRRADHASFCLIFLIPLIEHC